MLIPTIILLIALLIYLSFFLYNRCILSQDAYLLAFRGSIRKQEDESAVRGYIEQLGKEQFGNKYIGMRQLEKSLEISDKKVVVKLKGKTANGWVLTAVGQADRNDPVKYIRRIRLIKKAGEGLRGMGED
ncbi:hypothetical protein EDD76_12155 [Kineothrix alysoides]|uniref:TadE-like protein n=2 Tax=Kineothrix alysoides TaxID=1469948 RepID=A0A4R1QPM4_9FIRM|nr:hypothetical protein EDD76_12155 [Kineothrix alysoides]